jgi:hypothetical protein
VLVAEHDDRIERVPDLAHEVQQELAVELPQRVGGMAVTPFVAGRRRGPLLADRSRARAMRCSTGLFVGDNAFNCASAPASRRPLRAEVAMPNRPAVSAVLGLPLRL